MLRHLSIRNLAVIERLELDFTPGFTVLTGETGAGKSILIDAIGLIRGQRADSTLVRSGAPQAEVSAEFALAPGSAAQQWLAAQALDDPDALERCLIRRAVQASGRTRAFINDRAVSLSALRELGDTLVEIFGQGESQTLVRPDVQRELLDASGDHAKLLRAVVDAAAACQAIARRSAELRHASPRDPEQIDYLRFQIDELRALAVAPDEVAALEGEQRRLAHADRVLSDGSAAQDALYGADDSLYDRLAATQARLGELARFEPRLAEVGELVNSAQTLVHEAADSLRSLLNHAALDPERLQAVEARMAALHEMARKHHVRPVELTQRLEVLEQELASVEGAANQLQELQAQAAAADTHYRGTAVRLSAARKQAAAKLARAVTARVRHLGMAHAEFAVQVDTDPAAAPTPHGADHVRFDFTANPGQTARPLAKVASGGELSRISLALQVAIDGATPIGTMIFDEVDTGIGGAVADTVGRELAALGQLGQVLCVTHLAQVAAQGEHHLFIHKQVRDGATYTNVVPLDREGRITELARMASGHQITPATEAHARELLGTRAS
ncbi:MAG TPA: DNA repair protein RecN [Nevskiaceae bacterium]|nr:DNA repair protein RecN [Nevskiaceae bacterium]